MNTLYNFVSGPLVWVSMILFFGGSIYRIVSMGLLAQKKDNVVFAYADFKYGSRSILRWITPFATTNMRRHPLFTLATFIFHLCLLAAPLFVFAHITLINESWGISWPHLSDAAADVMSFIVLFACIFFAVRRIKQPEVKFLTTPSDFGLLAVVAAPFLTGVWAYHQWAGYEFMSILHILSGEIMLAAIPFTRLSHMIFFPFTRGYIGSEFGAVRHAQDW